jgi:hypothetical protein
MSTQELTNEEWQAVQEMRLQKRDKTVRNGALEEAARLADSWADESGGGSGKGGEGWRNFASAIRKMMT